MKKKFGDLTLKEVSGICGDCCGGECSSCAFKDLTPGCVFDESPVSWPLNKEIEIPECSKRK